MVKEKRKNVKQQGKRRRRGRRRRRKEGDETRQTDAKWREKKRMRQEPAVKILWPGFPLLYSIPDRRDTNLETKKGAVRAKEEASVLKRQPKSKLARNHHLLLCVRFEFLFVFFFQISTLLFWIEIQKNRKNSIQLSRKTKVWRSFIDQSAGGFISFVSVDWSVGFFFFKKVKESLGLVYFILMYSVVAWPHRVWTTRYPNALLLVGRFVGWYSIWYRRCYLSSGAVGIVAVTSWVTSHPSTRDHHVRLLFLATTKLSLSPVFFFRFSFVFLSFSNLVVLFLASLIFFYFLFLILCCIWRPFFCVLHSVSTIITSIISLSGTSQAISFHRLLASVAQKGIQTNGRRETARNSQLTNRFLIKSRTT